MRRGRGLLACLIVAGALVGMGGGAAGASTATFTSAHVGRSGSTPAFSMSSPWTMQWSFDGCGTATLGFVTGNFIVTVIQPAGDAEIDTAPDELGTSGSGTDHYYDTGSFSLSIVSTCSWSIAVVPSTSGPAALPVTFTSTSVGRSGSTEEFRAAGAWTLHWSYSKCSGGSGSLLVTIQQLTGGFSADIGPNALGTGGSGADAYTNAGTFDLQVLSECAWSISVGGATAAPPPSFSTYTRIDGPTADATAARELEHQFAYDTGACPGTASARPVVLATDEHFPDALASAYLARALGTGTLLTPGTVLSSATRTALRVEGVTHVYVVGGPLAVSTAVVGAIASTPAYACGGASELPGVDVQVTRIWGATEYTTAEQIASYGASLAGVGKADVAAAYSGTNASGGAGTFNGTSGSASNGPAGTGALPTAIVATGHGFQDAESASTLAYAEKLPILLTTPAALSAQAASAIGDLGIEQVIVMGGPLAVSNAVVGALQSLGVSVLRVAGSDYAGTAVQLASLETAASPTGLGWTGTGDITVARGDFYTDGLAGAVVAADGPSTAAPEPLLLTLSPTEVGSALAAFLRAAGTSGIGGTRVSHLTILGGPLALTQTTITAMGMDL